MSNILSERTPWINANDIELGGAIFGALAEHSSDFIGLASLDGEIRYVNPTGRVMLGLPNLNDKRKLRVRDLYTEADFIRQQEIYEIVKKNGRWDGERKYRHYQTGEAIAVYQSIFLVRHPETKEISLIGSLARNLVEEKRLLSHLSLFKKAAESSTEGLVIADARIGDYPIVYVNPAFTRITGYEASEVAGRNLRFLQGPGSSETLETVRKALRSKTQAQSLVKNFKKDGSVLWNQLSISPVKNASGETTHFVGIQRDVTNEMLARNELTRETERLQLILSSIEMGIWEWNLQPDLMTWDKQLYKIHKMKPGDLPEPKTWWRKYLGADHLEKIYASCLRDPNGKNNVLEPTQVTYDDGEVKFVRHMARLVRNHKKEPERIIGVAWDVTAEIVSKQIIDNQRLQIEASARLAALGEMAGGIAHEINNPLAIITAFVDRILDARGQLKEEELEHCLNRISFTANRIAGIVKGLRAVAREGSADPFEKTTVQVLINDTLSLCSERARFRGVNLLVTGELNLPVECRPVQICQVLANLISNALFAVDSSQLKWVRISCSEEPEHVVIEVTDSGPGIPKEISSKIFQPFFTTKGAGSGTGLGLSISTSLIKDHGGTLTLDSSKPETTFVVRLPKSQT